MSEDHQPSVTQLISSINQSTHSLSKVYAEYRCEVVSWDDAARGTSGGSLSVWGANITDTRLWAKDGRKLFTVRSDNWNEKLGHVSADQIRLVAGNSAPSGTLRNVTLKKLLQETAVYGGYAGLTSGTSLYQADLDTKVSIRFQTTFLPVENRDKATLEFATEAYNYNTRSDEDPSNLVILATTQGLAVQQDGAGAKKLYHHTVDTKGVIHRHWLEAERTEHEVGGEQQETEEEKQDAIEREKAVAQKIGIEAMGERFNVLMTIQVPLKQVRARPDPLPEIPKSYQSFSKGSKKKAKSGTNKKRKGKPRSRVKRVEQTPIGEANAARVSRGTEVDTWSGLNAKVRSPTRSPGQHVTVTVVFYNTIAGGVPTERDIVAAIDDMEALYKACNWTGHLADKQAEFMKHELTEETMAGINEKIENQPYTSESAPRWCGIL